MQVTELRIANMLATALIEELATSGKEVLWC